MAILEQLESSRNLSAYTRFNGDYLAGLALGQQYAHISEIERPTTDFINIIEPLKQNARLAALNDRSIRSKREANAANSPPDLTPIYLTRPLDYFDKPNWNGEKQNRRVLAQHVLDTLQAVYGETGYPYPLDMVAGQIDSGKLLPYVAYLGPQELINGAIYENPDRIKDRNLIPVAVSGINLREGGWGELGKFAQPKYYTPKATEPGEEQKEPLDIEWFKGGGLVQEMILDWATNRFGLMEAISLLYADMRVADKHHGNPHSGNVQKLLLGWGQMGIMAVAPMYDVNGYETMMRVARYRDLEKVREINRDQKIYIAPGEHERLLTLMWQHQLGQDYMPQFERENTESKTRNRVCQIEDNGKTIYGAVKIGLEQPGEVANMNLDEALDTFDEKSPSTVVQIAADSPESIATQEYLMSKGFIHCGISAATDDEVLVDIRDRSKGTRNVKAPPVVYMAKLGKPVRDKVIPIADCYFPEPNESGGVDLHGGPELRQALRDVTSRLNTIPEKNA